MGGGEKEDRNREGEEKGVMETKEGEIEWWGEDNDQRSEEKEKEERKKFGEIGHYTIHTLHHSLYQKCVCVEHVSLSLQANQSFAQPLSSWTPNWTWGPRIPGDQNKGTGQQVQDLLSCLVPLGSYETGSAEELIQNQPEICCYCGKSIDTYWKQESCLRLYLSFLLIISNAWLFSPWLITPIPPWASPSSVST